MRIGVVINPISGRIGHRASAGSRRLDRARRLVAHAGVDAEIVLTRASGHAADLARAFADRGFDVVVAWGGDGTINEAAGPLIGSRTALGIIPSGSGDGLALSLGVPLGTSRAFAAAVSERVAAVDVGYLAGRHFLNVAGVGFDAAVGQLFNQRLKRGAAGYATQSLRTVWSYKSARYRVRLDDEVSEGERFLVAFANGKAYGNFLILAADADPRDGWLNAVVVDAGSPMEILWRSRRLALAPLRPARGIRRTRVRTASVSGDRLVCHVDGETFEASGTIDVGIAPGALLVRGL